MHHKHFKDSLIFDQVLQGLHFTYAYIYDVFIASHSSEEYLCQWFKQYNIVINPGKCEFRVEQLQFLGHLVKKGGIAPLEDKAVKDLP